MCWARDLLKVDIPNARILTLGCGAQVIDFWNQPSQTRIAFLGTPHTGSPLAAWVETGGIFLEHVGLASNKELARNLDINSEVPVSLGRDFPTFLASRFRDGEEIKIMCFFEGMKFKGARKASDMRSTWSQC